MAVRPLEVKIDADVKGAVRGLDTLADSLDDVIENLDDLADEGDDTARELANDFRKIERAADEAGDKVKRHLGEGFDEAKGEALQSGREAAASFSGGFDDVTDFIQETAANAFGGFGPAGAAAGLVAAAGIGLATAAIEAVNEENEKSQERIAEWADAYIEAGGRILTAGVQAARFQEILTDPEKFKEAEKNAGNWGVAVETAIAAMSGSEGAIRDVEVALRYQKDASAAAAEEAQKAAEESGGVLLNLTLQEQAYLDGATALSKLTGEMEAGSARARLLNGYYEDLINQASGATKEVDELGNELYTLPDGTQIMIDAETRQASQNVSNFKGDLDGIPETVTSTVKVRADTSSADATMAAWRRRQAQHMVKITGKPVATWE